MSRSVTVRKGTVKDVNKIVSLGIKTFRDTFDEYNTKENMELFLADTYTIEKVAAEFSEKGMVYFLAEMDDNVVGFAKVRETENPEGIKGQQALELVRLYVDKDYLSRGLGKLLMETCLSYAREKKFQIVWLGVWEHNHRALKFYTKYGFERFSQHIFYVGNDPQTDFLLKKYL